MTIFKQVPIKLVGIIFLIIMVFAHKASQHREMAYFFSEAWGAFATPRSPFLALVARLLAKSADVILASPGGRREREVGKTDVSSS